MFPSLELAPNNFVNAKKLLKNNIGKCFYEFSVGLPALYVVRLATVG
jgi:hypothetical protein